MAFIILSECMASDFVKGQRIVLTLIAESVYKAALSEFVST